MNPLSRNKLIAAIAVSLALSSCFTGVESTPKITSKDVRKRNAVESAEMQYASGLVTQPPRDWTSGKEFVVTDSRISYALTPVERAMSVIPGERLVFQYAEEVPSMTDVDDTDFVFLSQAGDTLRYRVDAPVKEIELRDRLEVPFTIEQSLVDSAQALLAGNEYWITTPVWFDETGENIVGRQLVKVHIDSVTPGNTVYPLSVCFTDERGQHSRVFMSAGTGPRATRNFDTLFTLTDPRSKYKDISPETWDYITRCAVRKDMTREECRLAVGSPNEVFYGHYIERWNYDNGRYLIFDDDHLRSFRF
ncbi:MAG: hypothetical protein K2I64_00355 [Muribaculaceae bacterium]|nr:hypothetical protein [Muribaculaceae bacterium]